MVICRYETELDQGREEMLEVCETSPSPELQSKEEMFDL